MKKNFCKNCGSEVFGEFCPKCGCKTELVQPVFQGEKSGAKISVGTIAKNIATYLALAALLVYAGLMIWGIPNYVKYNLFDSSVFDVGVLSLGFWYVFFAVINLGIVALCVYLLVVKKKPTKTLFLCSLLYVLLSILCTVIGIIMENSVSSYVMDILNSLFSSQKMGAFHPLCIYAALVSYAGSSFYLCLLWFIALVLFIIGMKIEKKQISANNGG